MTDALQDMLDKHRLNELVLTYCRAVDRRDFALVRSLYHEDAIDDHGAMFSGPIDAFIAWLPDAMAQFEATQHSISNALFEIAGDRANGEAYVIAYHRTHPPAPHEVVIGGRYLDRYERRHGTWKFIHRSLALDWCNARPADPAAYEQFAAGAAAGRTGPSDPSYAALPLFRRFAD